MLVSLVFLVLLSSYVLQGLAKEKSLCFPIYKTSATRSRTRTRRKVGEVELGDFLDITYTVMISVGGSTLPLILDTGSSDLWIISTTCTSPSCTNTQASALYPQQSFQSTGLNARLFYGDSRTGTHAFGSIGIDKVDLAGLGIDGQYFAAVNDTNTSVIEVGAVGILGLGFPLNSAVWFQVFRNDYPTLDSSMTLSKRGTRLRNPGVSVVADRYLRRADFPPLYQLAQLHSSLQGSPGQPIPRTLSPSPWTQLILSSFQTSGPLLTRLITTHNLPPMFTVTLQRETDQSDDSGKNGISRREGNEGILTIGALPEDVDEDKLTWVRVRRYSVEGGGIASPLGEDEDEDEDEKEGYSLVWEVPLEGIFIDGMKLPMSELVEEGIGVTALVDTGSSLIRGPGDTIGLINSILRISYTSSSSPSSPSPSFPPPSPPSPSYIPCTTPHTLAFQIGGKMFPVDWRDLVERVYEGGAEDQGESGDGSERRENWCVAKLAETDVPEAGGAGGKTGRGRRERKEGEKEGGEGVEGGYLYSWCLGVPFLKSVQTTFYFGNFTHPSRDPARVGFLSTVLLTPGTGTEVAVGGGGGLSSVLPGMVTGIGEGGNGGGIDVYV